MSSINISVAYLLLEDDGSFKQFRQYGEGRNLKILVGLTEPNSNYKMLFEKVKEIKASIPVKSIKQQQKQNEYEQLFVCPKCGSRMQERKARMAHF